MSAALGLYRAAWAVGLALRIPSLLLRGRPEELAERLGRCPPGGEPGPLWIHAASLGEMAAAEPLVAALRDAAESPRLALSAVTRTGRERAGALAPDVGPFHAPLDDRRLCARCLDRLRPRGFLIIENEVWPNLMHEVGQRRIPWAIVSARLSEPAFRRMWPWRGLFGSVLAGAAGIGARSGEDAERYVALGAVAERVRVTGDLKTERQPPPYASPRSGVPCWVAACTRPGEEDAVLTVVGRLAQDHPSGELVLAPRHPGRFAQVAALVGERGLPLRRWDQRHEPPGEGWSVLLVDRLGVLAEAYQRGAFAFVGGSLSPHGGHSPLEAAAGGRAVVMGPNTDNCRDAVARLTAVDALRTVNGPEELGTVVGQFLSDPGETTRRGRAAWDVAAAGSGVVGATLAFLRERQVIA